MPRHKDLKRLVRARMQKTGEAYTAARAQIIKRPRITSRPPVIAVRPLEYAALAGMSDAAVKAKTGCTWERWVKALDRHDAVRMSHGEIAALVRSKYKIALWWSQNVAGGYERIKGLRARGQQRNGMYEMNKSRTFNIPVTALFAAWSDAGIRRRWLDVANVKVRTATSPKSMRLGWADGSIIAVQFSAKGASKSAVAVSQSGVPDRDSVDRLKEYWSKRLDALGEVLGR